MRAVAVVRILGIDPGTRVVGFGCLELPDGPADGLADGAGEGTAAGAPSATPLALRAANVVRVGRSGALRAVECGVLRLGGREQPVAVRLLALCDQFRRLLARLAPDELALEEAFQGKSVPAALRIGEARGVVLAEAARAGLAIHQYPPARIKRCVAGHGSARKTVVATMVLGQLGTGPAAGQRLPADATDALAVAMTRAEERRSPLLRALRPGS